MTLSRVLAQPRRLQPCPARLGVRVRVAGQDLLADEVLEEAERAARRRVVRVGHAARAVRAGHHLIVSDHRLPDPGQERRCEGGVGSATGYRSTCSRVSAVSGRRSSRLCSDDPRERRRAHDGPVAAHARARSQSPATTSRVGSGRTSGPCRRPTASTSAAAASLPAFTDSHVHFPTWSLAQTEIALDGRVVTRRRRSTRVGSTGARGSWIRGRGWRDADWAGEADRGGARRGDRRHAGSALVEGLPLAVAQHRRARARRRGPPGPGRRRRARRRPGRRPGSCARSRPGSSASASSPSPTTSGSRRRATGIRLANTRGVAAIHDKDGWLGAPRIFGRIHEREGLTLRVWQSVPHERVTELVDGRDRATARRRLPPARLPEGVHGRDARLADRVDARRLGRVDHLAATSCRRSSAPARRQAGRSAVHAIGDRANREALDAFEATRDALGAARAASPHRARAVPRPGGHPALRGARSRLLRAVHARAFRSRSRRALLGRAGSPARTRSARCSTPARSWPTARTRRSRSSIRLPVSAPG